jgi:hypothetical protein
MRLLRFHRKDGSSSLALRVAGTAAILLIALLAYLSVDPEAHERFHHDADEPGHHCVVTEFAAGEALVLTVAFRLLPLIAHFVRVQWVQVEVRHDAVDLVLLPSCGPPAGALRV